MGARRLFRPAGRPVPGPAARPISRTPMPMKRNRPTRLAAVLLLLMAFVAAGCASQIPGLYPPQDATSQGKSVRDLYDIVFILAAAIFLVVEGLIVYAVVRYRRK